MAAQICETCKKKNDWRCYCSPNSVCTEYEEEDTEEIPIEVIGLDIKVRTNKGNEITIQYSDIKGHLCSQLNLDHDYYDNYTKINLVVECFGYKREILR